MTKSYAGIGSRETPQNVLDLMVRIGAEMARQGYRLRSGGANGADAAFEQGAFEIDPNSREIYLPWRGFNGHRSNLCTVTPEAEHMASQFHPNWAACSQGARKMHARNCHQVLGAGLNDPVELVICWTRNAAGGGGTGQALRIARHHNILIHDLADPKLSGQYVHRLIELESTR